MPIERCTTVIGIQMERRECGAYSLPSWGCLPGCEDGLIYASLPSTAMPPWLHRAPMMNTFSIRYARTGFAKIIWSTNADAVIPHDHRTSNWKTRDIFSAIFVVVFGWEIGLINLLRKRPYQKQNILIARRIQRHVVCRLREYVVVRIIAGWMVERNGCKSKHLNWNWRSESILENSNVKLQWTSGG